MKHKFKNWDKMDKLFLFRRVNLSSIFINFFLKLNCKLRTLILRLLAII